MPKYWTVDTSESISFSKFIDFIENSGEQPITDRLDECINILKRVYNNRNILNEAVAHNFNQFVDPKAAVDYSFEGFVWFQTPTVVVRSVIWLPDSNEKDLSSSNFEGVHDHNFNLLTLNFHGSGYVSSLWEYELSDCYGYIGENVNATYLGKRLFEPKSIMLYEANKDIHLQHPPNDFTISINIMERANISQFLFSKTPDGSLRIKDKITTYLAELLSKYSLPSNYKMEIINTLYSRLNDATLTSNEKLMLYNCLENYEDFSITDIALKETDSYIKEFYRRKLSL